MIAVLKNNDTAVYSVINEITDLFDEHKGESLSKQLVLLLDNDSSIAFEKLVENSWLERLENQTISSFIDCYLDLVRKFVIKENNALDMKDVCIVKCYQVLLRRVITTNCNHFKYLHSSENIDISEIIEQLPKDVLELSRDIYSFNQDSKIQNLKLRSMVLASLINIIEHVLEICKISHFQLARIFALLLSSFKPRPDLLGSLLPSYENKDVLDYCVIPIKLKKTCKSVFASVELPAIDIWNDRNIDSAIRSCRLLIAQSLDIDIRKDDDLLRDICGCIGWKAIAKAVHTQFFEMTKEKQKKKGKPLVQKSTSTSYPLKISATPMKESLHRIEKSRINAAIHFIHLLESESQEVSSDILPICLSLINSSTANLVALGSMILIKIFHTSPKGRLKSFEDNIVSTIDIALRTTSDNTTLIYICFACTKTIEYFDHRKKDRRRFTLKFINLLQEKMNRISEEIGLMQGIISVGLVPLWNQQTSIENMESVEIARPALRILLPLLRWDLGTSGKRLQIFALLGLINLIVTAYPIMTNHSAKIICELFACWGHASNSLTCCKGEEFELCQVMMSVATHATAIALIFCGDRAHQTVAKIQSATFNACLIKHAQEVEEKYEELLQQIPPHHIFA